MRKVFSYGSYICSFLVLFCLFLSIQPNVYGNSARDPFVYYIPVEQTVERGLQAFLTRAFHTAEEEGATHIVLEMDTPGGAVDAAGNIGTLIRETDIPVITYVKSKAISAGAYIALNTDEIVMAPGATMGAAKVIDGAGNAAEDKAQSYWLAEMRSSAELNGRDPIYALAMADERIEIPKLGVTDKDLLTLTADQALEVGYAEAIAENRAELLDYLDLEHATEKEMKISFSEQIARFVTHPIVIPILLSIGSLGLVLELYSPGFGVPGMMGISALFLFFFGHMIAGFAGMEAMLLVIVGIILILIEVFVPGFGIFGLLGLGAVIGGMLLASFSTAWMIISILIALIVTGIAVVILFRYFGKRGPMKKVILHESATSEQGYISNETRKDLLGHYGKTITPLRPAGSISLGTERLDVVSEGGYIEQDRKVMVVYAAGSRIVVREVKN
ncbi:nodulation protein NfeD [bacterium LRH843]|nr:nodulation protein NfeD [bacterium LRH843]